MIQKRAKKGFFAIDELKNDFKILHNNIFAEQAISNEDLHLDKDIDDREI